MLPRHPVRNAQGAAAHAKGVVLLALLLALALGGVAAMAAADVWSLSRQREREQELLFVGEQYRQAIERYFLGAPPGIARALPSRLEDLLEDNRYPVPVHHLRRLYVDPVTGGSEWGLLQVQGRIAGVHSLSEKAPIKQAGFDADHEHFTARSAYRDWVFAASVPGLPLMTKPSPGGHAPEPGAPTEPPRPVHRTPP